MLEVQFQVARGKKFCKAGCQIKNADLVTTDRPGRGNGQVGDFLSTSNLRAPTVIAPLASHWWRLPMTGSDKRRSAQSRCTIGLRRPLRKTPLGLEWQRLHLASAGVLGEFRK